MPKLTRSHLLVVLALALSGVAIVVVCSVHWFHIRRPNAVVVDDGYTVALAERLIDGHWLPYVDGCSHRGPVLYWVVALGQALFGRYSWASARWLMLVVSLITLLGLTGAGFAARLPLAGGIAALAFSFLALVGHRSVDGVAALGENVASAFGAVALCFAAWALTSTERARLRLVLLSLAGASVAMAGLTKQTALPLVLPLLGWTLARALSVPTPGRRARAAMPAALLAGFALPCLAVVGRYAVARELGTFWYWLYTYNADVYAVVHREVPHRERFDVWLREWPFQVFVAVFFSAWGLVRPCLTSDSIRGLARGYASAGLEATAAWMALGSILPMVLAKRFWPSYELLALPWVAMAIGAFVARSMQMHGAAPHAAESRPALAGPLLLALLLSGWTAYAADAKLRHLVERRKAGDWQAALPEPLCELVDQYSKPGEPLFIWGFDGDLYVTCKRPPATRFTYLTLVAGTAPPAWSPPRPEWVARDSRRHLLQDLERSRPPVVLDMPGKMGNVSLEVVPELVRHLNESYCRRPEGTAKDGRKAAVWVRKDRCPAQ